MRFLCTKGRLPVAVHTPYAEPGNDLKFLQDLQGLQGSFGMAVSFGMGGKESMPQNGS